MIKLSNLEEAANNVKWSAISEILTYAFTNKNGNSDTIRIEFSHDVHQNREGRTAMMVFYNNKRIPALDDTNITREEGIEHVRKYVESTI